jgi:16S rRNA (guanine527-N7)-methyltransferase
VADAGSGAGLPGIPLAIALPTVSVTLIERMGRRAGFLRNTPAALPLPNVEVIEADTGRSFPLEQPPLRRFDAIVFRAFKPLDKALVQDLFRLLAPGGFLAAYKGRAEKIAAEMEAVKEAVGSWETRPVRVPFLNEERHLVVIRQLATPP